MMEMPTPCADCGDILELNELYSMRDGSVLCNVCSAHAAFIAGDELDWDDEGDVFS